MDRFNARALPAAFVLVLLSSPAAATVIHVPADFPTIQAALNAATSGDQVLVEPGTYVEHLVLGSAQNGVSLTSSGGPDVTIIDGGRVATVITCSGVGAGTRIEGFTIRNGGQDPPYQVAGGIWLQLSSPVITGNKIRDNFAAAAAGIYVNGSSSPEITNNEFRNNVARYGSGGGIYYDNFAGGHLTGNTFEGNYADAYGGGVTIWSGSTPTVRNNTIVGNSAVLDGSGVYVTRNSHPDCQQNIVASHLTHHGVVVGDLLSTVTLSCNDVYGNQPSNYFGLADPTGSNGNISADPLFCDAGALDFHLNTASPCAAAQSPSGCGLIGALDVGCGAGCPHPAAVTLDVKPDKLNLKSGAKWVTAYIRTTPPLQASDIDVSSLTLNGVSVSTDVAPFIGEQNTLLKVRFDRQAVVATLTEGHVEVVLRGEIAGACIEASDFVDVWAPHITQPARGDQLTPGEVTSVQWDVDPEATSMSLYLATDDGAGWMLQEADIANTGRYRWTVPNAPSADARLSLVSVYEIDETGVVARLEYAVSDAFTIQSTLGVADGAAAFSLRAPNPMAGDFSLRFSLPSATAAQLAVFDIAGRAVLSREVGGRVGPQTVSFGRLPVGLYVVRLGQAGRTLSGRVTVVH